MTPSQKRIGVILIAVLGVGLLIGVILRPLNNTVERSPRVICLFNLKQIGMAINMYADEHEGKIPKQFNDLRPYAASLNKVLICPSAKNTNVSSYQILLGGKTWNSFETSNAVVVAEQSGDHPEGHHVLYGDGHVSLVSDQVH